jgi:hypothetical protein
LERLLTIGDRKPKLLLSKLVADRDNEMFPNGEMRGREFNVGDIQDQMIEGKTLQDNPSYPHKDMYPMLFDLIIEYGTSFIAVSFAISVVKDSICSMSSSNLSIFEQPERMRVFKDFN